MRSATGSPRVRSISAAVTRSGVAVSLIVIVSMMSAVGYALIPEEVPNLPVLLKETPSGRIVTAPAPAVAPVLKTVDGNVTDWTGEITRLAGSSIYSKGEFVYQDYLNDAWGGDDGLDHARLYDQSGTGVGLATLKDIEPRTYRLDPFAQAYRDQLCGLAAGFPPCSLPISARLQYGDADTKVTASERYQADIEEVRVAADLQNVYFLVRTIGMLQPTTMATLILLDIAAGGSYTLPVTMGGITTGAEWAVLAHGNQVVSALYQGTAASCSGCVVTTNPGCTLASSGCSMANASTNAMEVSIPLSLIGNPSKMGAGVATGAINDASSPTGLKNAKAGDAKSSLINVAFRNDEPVRIWMDQSQALALLAGDIDKYLTSIEVAKLVSGNSETFDTGPGYYEATYATATAPIVTNELDFNQSMYQHYGVYVPTAYQAGTPLPTTFWMHYRGGHAHDAGAWLPGVIDEFGEKGGSSPLCALGDPLNVSQCGAFVITPSARGTSTWYTGRGMVDFMDVWDDSHERFPIDENRTYVAGHSMGGWASFLLGTLMPDRWAASNPEDGLLVPALCLGPFGVSGQNGQSTDSNLYNILENARNLPFAILHGAVDELVPISCALAAGAKLHTLGYRYRNYTFLAYEHFSAPIWDDWDDVVRYMYQFTRDPNPARVVYKTWPFLNNQINTVNGAPGLNLNFNGAYWVSEMAVRTGGIAASNIGTVDATTWGRSNRNPIAYPEAGTAAQPEPNLVNGQAWVANDIGANDLSGAPANRFTATLTNLSTVTFDIARMGFSTTTSMNATVTTDGNSSLVLNGSWTSAPTVTGANGFSWDSTTGAVTLTFAGSGARNITITP